MTMETYVVGLSPQYLTCLEHTIHVTYRLIYYRLISHSIILTCLNLTLHHHYNLLSCILSVFS